MRRHRDDPPIVLAIPDDNAPIPPARRPTWWSVRTVRAIGFVFVGLAVAMSLLSAYISWSTAVDSARQSAAVERRLAALEEYVQGRGEFRDAEAERLQEEIRESVCDLLDQLPDGGLLDRPRDKYGCGPGIPLSQLPPNLAEQLRNQRDAASQAAPGPDRSSSSAASPRDGAAPGGADRPPESAPEPPPVPEPPADPARPPLVDLGPITDPVCESVRVCF